MEKFILITFIIIGFITMSNSCEKELSTDNQLATCDFQKIVKTVSDVKGTIWYNDKVHAYSIYTSIDGTYDSQDVGIVCNLPDRFETKGLEILFSGSYYTHEEVSPIPGQTYYNLELSKIQSIGEN